MTEPATRRRKYVRLVPLLLATAALACCAAPTTGPGAADAATGANGWTMLPGWATSPIADAIPALVQGCARLALTPVDQQLGGSGPVAARAGQAGQWAAVCAAARRVPPADEPAARAFLQARFDVVPLTDTDRPAGLFTGYYEPEVEGSRERTRAFHVPLLARPADLIEQRGADGGHQIGRAGGADGTLIPYYTRAEIEAGALRRQRLDLLYLRSPIDLFFLQIQGAGRIVLPNGRVVRVGYAAGNGQPYVPIGRILGDRGDLPPDQLSAATIRAWLQAHPRDAAATMALNPSYTFFREVPALTDDQGPLGTLQVPLTPLRSVAVDPHHVPLGAPLWVETTDADGAHLQGLMLAQDTGSGVAGAVRADIFFGWGDRAADRASRMQSPGRAWLLLPKTTPVS